MSARQMSHAVLQFERLSLEFPTPRGVIKALENVTLEVRAGEIVGVVGESGSGKSVLAMTAMQLLARSSYRVTAGRVTVLGQDVLTLDRAQLENLRGAQIAMVFQEPMNALNPTMSVGAQLEDVIRRHRSLGRAAARTLALELLRSMSFADPPAIARSYPHSLSGGMRQRILLAMAFACQPRILIADEPTTALDVTVQAQILSLIAERARDFDTAVLLITHDMAVVSQISDRVYVVYAGTVVEAGNTQRVLAAPQHPYTRALLNAMPANHAPKTVLPAIAGVVPSMIEPPSGCRFGSRCDLVQSRCAIQPAMTHVEASSHSVACWSANGVEGSAP
jgi:peptide/nickel transport system ATP-binding protein